MTGRFDEATDDLLDLGNRLTTLSPVCEIGSEDGPKLKHLEDNMCVATATINDPVCGMRLAPETAAAQQKYDGHTYYFCSSQCAATFVADPTRYAAASIDS